MPENTDKSKTEQIPSSRSPSTSCSPLLAADTAPRDGNVILGAFGWPFLIPAAWNGHDERWTVCTMQAQQMDSGNTDVWWETDWEPPNALLGWVPMPELPTGCPTGGFLYPAND